MEPLLIIDEIPLNHLWKSNLISELNPSSKCLLISFSIWWISAFIFSLPSFFVSFKFPFKWVIPNSKYYTGEGPSKKDAEQNAAILCLDANL